MLFVLVFDSANHQRQKPHTEARDRDAGHNAQPNLGKNDHVDKFAVSLTVLVKMATVLVKMYISPIWLSIFTDFLCSC